MTIWSDHFPIRYT